VKDDIYILGVNESHNATACLLKNGEVIGCISEERLCREKNFFGFPRLATDYLLKENGISIDAVASLVVSFENPILLFHNVDYAADNKNIADLFPFLKRLADEIMYHFPRTRTAYQSLYEHLYKPLFWGKMRRLHAQSIVERTGISPEKIVRANHHLCHALSAYYSFPRRSVEGNLIVTLDGVGDDSCASVMCPRADVFDTVARTSNGNSPGMLYAYITDYLGMKMGEHEYKVMGMSPYASQYESDKAYERIKDLFLLQDDLTFKSKIPDTLFGRYLKEKLYHCRFDGIAGATQRYIEELLCAYVREAVKRTGSRRIFCGGGVFMNVKANKAILQLPEVESAYFMPSSGDESTAIGAAYYGYNHVRGATGGMMPVAAPVRDLYLGTRYGSGDIRAFIENNRIGERFNVYQDACVEKKVAELLAGGHIVARLRGRMEWGARALGNRSILAHPTDCSVVRVLNSQIKSRDFWMPFAGTVLVERFSDYLLPLKETDNSVMMVAYGTTDRARKELAAAIHPYDFTMRAQVLNCAYNPDYHALISEFQRLTGVGGILNTSFNLHGEPMVCSPADAIHTLADSGLEILALEDFIISKKPLR